MAQMLNSEFNKHIIRLIKFIALLNFNFILTGLILFSYSAKADGKITQQTNRPDTYYISQIVVRGIVNHENNETIAKIIRPYFNSHLSFDDFEKIRSEIESVYKQKGDLFVKVKIPQQDISDGIFEIQVIKGIVGDIRVQGNEHYSSEFITDNFSLKEGDFLEHDKMIESLLFLNEYSDLKVKSFPKKGTEYATTDLELHVEDENPFHFTVVFDNLGSDQTSRNRVATDLFYGNLLKDGDETDLSYVHGLVDSNTELVRANYAFRVGNKHTKINMGYLYANYIAASGDFSVLEMKGDTAIYTAGATQPVSRSTTNKVDTSFNYANKKILNYLLGSTSSKDILNVVSLSGLWQHMDIYSSLSLSADISRGFNGDVSFGSRVNENPNFFKYNVDASYQRYLNETNNLLLSAKTQYSSDKLPLVEMFSVGGMGSIRGFDPSFRLGDSGFSSSIQWNYHPKFENEWLKDSLQIGLFFDHGAVFVNDPVPGEKSKIDLSGTGVELKTNIKERFFATVTVGVPVQPSVEIQDQGTLVYVVIGAKLW